jgi:hypothetical protein
LLPQEIQILSKSGIDVNKLPKVDLVRDMFYFGLLSDVLGRESKKLSFAQLQSHLSNPREIIPLNAREKAVINSIKNQYLGDIRANEGRIFRDINNIIAQGQQNNRQAYEQVITDEVLKGTIEKKTVSEIARDISRKTGDWSRDFNRIVGYISHKAFDEGRASMYEKKGGEDILVYKDTFGGVCQHCIRLYLTNGLGSQPKIFKLSELKANGTNIGRKSAEWKAVIGATHPHCYDKETDVLTKEGWKNWQEVTGKEEFLSVNPINGKSSWEKAISLVKYKYDDVMMKFSGNAFDLMVTPNHRHFIKSKKSKSYIGSLISGENLSFSSSFVNISKGSWSGVKYKEKIIGDTTTDFASYCKFMGWYLSEGCCFKKKGRNTYVLDISQEKVKNFEEIRQLFEVIFGKKPIETKGHFSIYVNKKIASFFMKFGHSFDKFVPMDIKNSTPENINLFLSSFCKGDGNERVRENNFIKSKPSKVFFTSSPKLASDIGELLIKVDFRPSYFVSQPKEVKHKNGIYLSKNNLISIYANRSKTSQLKRMSVEFVDYNDYVYDVELEKNHTLYVRRGGKVTISGNCRCTLNEVPQGYEWNPETNSFDKPIQKTPQEKQQAKRNPIRVTFNGKEYSV